MKTTRSLCLQTIDIRRNALTWELQVVGQNVACSEFKHQSPLSQQWSALSRARARSRHTLTMWVCPGKQVCIRLPGKTGCSRHILTRCASGSQFAGKQTDIVIPQIYQSDEPKCCSML